jgi:NAD dependent epimerase/dehydratase family enzyme
MGRELVLASTRVKPERLEQAGFEWEHPEIDSALQACVNGVI